MSRIIGTNIVGVLIHPSGKYVCWNNDAETWFLSNNINDAQHILGNKELNAEKMADMYEDMTGDTSDLRLATCVYCYMSDDKESHFITADAIPAYAYATEN